MAERPGGSLEDINFGDLDGIFDDPLLEDLIEYAELNPAFRFWESGDDHFDPSVAREFQQIFFDRANQAREQREVDRRLELFRIAIRSKIEQLLGNRTWEEKGGSTEQNFRAAPRTFLKTVQEVLTDPAERMVFTRDDIDDPENAAIENIIIDPRRISNTLLHNLGLDEFIPKKGLRQEQQLKRRAEAIPKIREMLTGLEPVELPTQRTRDLNYFRLMRIGRGPNTGYVIGTQNIDGRKRLFKTDLYGAERRLVHIEESYHEEIRKLKWIEATLTDIRDRLQDWHSLKGSDDLEVLKQTILQCAESLEFVRDQDKRDILRKIKQFTEFKDSRGRYNPGKISAEITYTLRRLKNRYQRIERIWMYVGQDKARVSQIIIDEERPLQSFLQEVEKLHEKFRILRRGIPLEPAEKVKVVTNLGVRKSEARKLKYEPQLSFGQKFAAQTETVTQNLKNGQTNEAAVEFIKMYLITKLTRAHNSLQGIYKRISLYPDGIDPQTLLGQLEEIHSQLKMQLVAADIRTPEYDAAYGEVYHLLNSLKKRLRELLGMEDEQAKRPTVKSRAQKTVAVILEQALNRIPALRGIVERIRNHIPQNFKPDQLRPTRRAGYTVEEKTATFAMMKKRIGEFDFSDLIQKL